MPNQRSYLFSVSKGTVPQEALYILCGAIGTAGMGAYIGVYDGTCVVYSALVFCQGLEYLRHLGGALVGLAIFILMLILPCIVCLIMYCRRKGYPPETQEQIYELVDQSGLSSQRMDSFSRSGYDNSENYDGYGTNNPLQRSGDYDVLPTLSSSHHTQSSPYPSDGDSFRTGESPASIEMTKFAAGTTTAVSNDSDFTAGTNDFTYTDEAIRKQRLQDSLN